MSIRVNILIWLLICALGPMAVVALQGLHCSAQAVHDLETKHLRSLLQSWAARWDDWRQERERELRAISAGPFIFFGPEMGTVPEAIWTWEPGPVPTRKLVAGEVLPELPDSVPWATRPADAGGEAIWVVELLAVPTPGTLQSWLRCHLAVPLGTSWIVATWDLAPDASPMAATPAHGQPLLRVAPASPVLLAEAQDDELQKANVADPHAHHHGAEAVSQVSLALPELGLLLTGELATHNDHDWVRILGWRAFYTALAALVLVAILARHIAARLAAPLSKLAAIMRRVAGGQSQVAPGRFVTREANAMAEAFTHMMRELEASRTRLVQAAGLAAVGEFSASMVHEMRRPLATIRLNLEALHEAAGQSASQAELGELALRELQRLETMLNDILQLGRPVALQRQAVVPADLLRAALAEARRLAGPQAPELVLALTEPLPPLAADPELLQRAVSNLLDNALRATPPAGRIVLAARLLAPAAQAPGTPASLELTVTDSGPGIPASLLPRLFQPFASARAGGTGLGLANVRKIIEAHGGQVSGENLPEGGARFRLTLPVEGP